MHTGLVALYATLNDDRVSPPFAAMMNFNMLATMPCGRLYSAAEMEALLHRTGFERLEWHPLPDPDERAVIAWKQDQGVVAR